MYIMYVYYIFRLYRYTMYVYGHCILVLKAMHPHNYESALRMFLNFSTIKETKR